MTSKEIRQTFLNFFKSKEHEIVPSAPMVIKNDPTLMFTNAGMNQFKDFFLGNAVPKNPRIADTQKCLRVSGKHNDLEEVGVDTYHHTMFEMLGNWSFGDYFKKEAIEWAWELLTEVYKIDKDKLYVTVFGGDEKDNLPKDNEAIDFWKKHISPDRILQCSKKDNFWEMGDTGPCGPCSEIHVDIRDDAEGKKQDGKTLVNTGHPQVIEIWNLVFIQFERKADGSLKQLPAKHVDTGMGFERLCMVLQNKKSNYDTDVFGSLINEIEKITKLNYVGINSPSPEERGQGGEAIAMRVISDHIRTISFSIADGQLPSNTGAGYVIRRILRRAVRYGYSFLKMDEPFIYKLVPVLTEQMGGFFPELKSQKDLIEKVIKEEEENFLRTLERGLKRMSEYFMEKIKKTDIYKQSEELVSGKIKEDDFSEKIIEDKEFLNEIEKDIKSKMVIDGAFAFELFDTYGFPIDLTKLIAKEKGMTVDEKGFQGEMEKQKSRSRKDSKVDADDWVQFYSHLGAGFVGYDKTENNTEIVRFRKVKIKGKDLYQVCLAQTPFYGESGGQVGDTGIFICGDEQVNVVDTKKENGMIVHYLDAEPNIPSSKKVIAKVNNTRRELIKNNHSATHLLHEALRKFLGTHVQQKGSLVHPDYLRFDFSHFQKMTEEEIEKVELFVNEKIRKNISAEIKEMPIEEAKKTGAMALFGEKYGDIVRVVKFGDSVELCGGTHVQSTGQIGFFKIISESAVAAGVRRIEAIAGEKAQQFISEQLKKLESVSLLLKNPKDIEKAINDLLSSNAELAKQIEILNNEKAKSLKDELLKKMTEVNGVNFISEKIDLDSSAIKNLAFQLKSQVENLFLILGNENNGKANITVALSDKLLKEKKLNASTIIRELAKEIQGGGGGQPGYATAGGSNITGIEKALKKAKEFIV